MRVRIGERDGRGVELVRRGRGEPALRFDTLELALHWLRRVVDPHELARLRALFAAVDPLGHRRDDEAVLRRLAQELRAGNLVAVALPRHVYADRLADDWQPTRRELPEPGLVAPSEPAPVEATPEPPPLPSLDAATQAGALRAAARVGTPFCELCTRAGAPG